MGIRLCISVSFACFGRGLGRGGGGKEKKKQGERGVDGNRSSKWSVLYFLAQERKNKHQTASPFKCALSGSSWPRTQPPPSSDRELLRLRTAPTPTLARAGEQWAGKPPALPRPLPAAPRGRKIGKHGLFLMCCLSTNCGSVA